MTFKKISLLLVVFIFLFGAGVTLASEPDAVHDMLTHGKADANGNKDHRTSVMAQRMKGPKVKLVDINGANKAALKKLPGITEAEAGKIIANRPYGSKMWLITNNVLERKTYEGISGLIEAKQPYKTAAENAALYEKLKKEKAAKANP